MSAALVDAGPLVAVFGRDEPEGPRYRALFKRAADELWSLATTWPCVVEASHLLDAPQRCTLLRWIAAGALPVFPFAVEQLEGMVELMRRYTESPRSEMDLADASLVATAERLDLARIFTLDHHFRVYRRKDTGVFDIVP